MSHLIRAEVSLSTIFEPEGPHIFPVCSSARCARLSETGVTSCQPKLWLYRSDSLSSGTSREMRPDSETADYSSPNYLLPLLSLFFSPLLKCRGELRDGCMEQLRSKGLSV